MQNKINEINQLQNEEDIYINNIKQQLNNNNDRIILNKYDILFDELYNNENKNRCIIIIEEIKEFNNMIFLKKNTTSKNLHIDYVKYAIPFFFYTFIFLSG